MPRIRGGEGRRPGNTVVREPHPAMVAVAIAVLVMIICAAVGLRAQGAAGDETGQAGEPAAAIPTAQQTEEAIEAARAERSEVERGLKPIRK